MLASFPGIDHVHQISCRHFFSMLILLKGALLSIVDPWPFIFWMIYTPLIVMRASLAMGKLT